VSDETPSEDTPAPPRFSGAVLASLLLVVFCIVGLARPPGLGPVGPLGAGILAFLGYRNIRASSGALRGAGLARIAMTASLVLLIGQFWFMWQAAPTSQAWGSIRSKVAAVDTALKSGTAESAWALLGEEAQGGLDRDAWLKAHRGATAELGGLRDLGDPGEQGGDWSRTGSFADGPQASLQLPMEFDATFANGDGTVLLEFLVQRNGRVVTVDLIRLDIEPR
jgi:hypothetical protein